MRELKIQIDQLNNLRNMPVNLQSEFVERAMSRILGLHIDIAILAHQDVFSYQVMSDDDWDFFSEYVDVYPNAQFFNTPLSAGIAYLSNRYIWQMEQMEAEMEAQQETLNQVQLENQRKSNDMGAFISQLHPETMEEYEATVREMLNRLPETERHRVYEKEHHRDMAHVEIGQRMFGN